MKQLGGTMGQMSGLSDLTAFRGGAAGPPLANLALWLKADVGLFQDSAGTTPATADNDPVGDGSDQSGNGNKLTQSTNGLRPNLKLAIQNGLPVIRNNDAVQSFLAGGSSILVKAAFVVAKYSGATFGGFYGLLTDTTTDAIFVGSNGTTNWFSFGEDTYRKNGVTMSSGAAGAGPMNTFAVMYMAKAGGWNITPQLFRDRTFAVRSWIGDLGELALLTAVPSAGDITAWESYLNGRWAIY